MKEIMQNIEDHYANCMLDCSSYKELIRLVDSVDRLNSSGAINDTTHLILLAMGAFREKQFSKKHFKIKH